MNIYEVHVSVKVSLPKKILAQLKEKMPFSLNTDFITYTELVAGNDAIEAKAKTKRKYEQLLPFYKVKVSKANSIVNNK